MISFSKNVSLMSQAAQIHVESAVGYAHEPQQPDYDIRAFMTDEELLKMKCERFRGFLPDADPDYIRRMALELGDDEQQIQVRILAPFIIYQWSV